MTTSTTTECFYSRYPLHTLHLTTITYALAFAACLFFLLVRGFAIDLIGGMIGVAGFASLYALAWSLRSRRHRFKRPVIEIGDREIEYGSVFVASRVRDRIPIEDIAAVSTAGADCIVLRRHSGESTTISLAEVAPAERDRVRTTIEQRIG